MNAVAAIWTATLAQSANGGREDLLEMTPDHSEANEAVLSRPERAILVGIEALTGESRHRMQELLELVRAAGASPIGVIVQRRRKPEPATFLGRGKVEELAGEVANEDADMVVFDAELSPTQVKNLADQLQCKVLDRSELILDIFAQHAHSREGKLQVELAQLTYLLPRLVGHGVMMSRIGGGMRGGIGVRGPGETKLEMDRYRLRQRIARLNRQLEDVRLRRDTERQARRQSGLATGSIVGYTNAGKSTVLNALAGSEEVAAHDRLFETLDPTVRRVDVGAGLQVMVSDTVGFIRDLPPKLIAAFRATLEEVMEADFIIEVIDASDPEAPGHHQATQQILDSLGVLTTPRVIVLNKWDLVPTDSAQAQTLRADFPEALPMSALTGEGLEQLQSQVHSLVRRQHVHVTVRLPYNHLELLTLSHSRGRVLDTDYQPEHVVATVEVDEETLGQLRPYIIAGQD